MLSLQQNHHFRLSPPSQSPFKNVGNTPFSLRTHGGVSGGNGKRAGPSLREEITPNALRRKRDPNWRGGFSLGVDLGMSRTGLAVSKGFSLRPLTVLELRGEKLELQLLEIAQNQEADEFVIGLPKSSDGSETVQSNKVQSVAGRLAVRAAQRGWRVFLFDEHGTTREAAERMINIDLSNSARRSKGDAYAAVMLLERYFLMFGTGTELVLPKSLDLQERLRQGPAKDIDFFDEGF